MGERISITRPTPGHKKNSMSNIMLNDYALAFAKHGWWVKFVNYKIFYAKNSKRSFAIYESFRGVKGIAISETKLGDRIGEVCPITEAVTIGEFGLTILI